MYPMQVTITISNEEQFRTLASAITGTVPAKAATKGKKGEEATAPAPPPEATQADTATAAGAIVPTMKDAQNLTLKIVQDKGRDAAVALLQKYGVAQAAKLQPGQIAGFVIDAEAVLNG